MKKVAVIGHLDWHGSQMIGAVAKSRQILDALVSVYGVQNVGSVDIFNWRKRKIAVLFSLILSFAKYKNLVLVMSDISPVLMALLGSLRKIFHCKVLYAAVGGDLGERLEKEVDRIPHLQYVDCFFVETKDCLDSMKRLGIDNVNLLFNFKNLIPVKKENIKTNWEEPFQFCTFSRVIEQKGITDAINATALINQRAGKKKCELHVYGAIDPSYEELFHKLISCHEECHYNGVVDNNKSVEVLKNYYCLLFPTKYQTEGIPGTIVDAFASALPIICSDWVRRPEIIESYITGMVYPFGSFNGLVKSMESAMDDSKKLCVMRYACLEAFSVYSMENAIRPLKEAIGE